MSSLITLCNGSGDHPVQLVKELQIGLTVENETLDGKVDLITRIKCPITESKNDRRNSGGTLQQKFDLIDI